MRRIVQSALLWYARRLPFHRGKQRLSEALRRIFHVSLEGEYIEKRGGLWWALNPQDSVQQDLFWSSAKDAAEIRQVLRYMPRGGVLFDLGAHFGYYSLTVATALQGDCRIYAFEPNPPTMRRLRRNLALNATRGVLPREEGLSDLPGRAEVVDPAPADSGAAYLARALQPGAAIPVTTLDLVCEQEQIERLDFVKMDIEGAEPRALRGGIATLERFRPVILIELNPGALERAGSSVQDVVALLEDLGYLIHTVRPRTRISRHSLPPPRQIVNALCIPDASRGKPAKLPIG